MVAWPTTGGSEGTWNDEMKAYVDVGHNTDGTHNQEDWTPTSYAGEESITFPNGLILKQGTVNIDADAIGTVIYAVPFPTGVVSAQTTVKNNQLSLHSAPHCLAAVANIQIVNDQNSNQDIYWQVWGY